MRTSEHYELNLVEGTDKVNPLVQDVPNYEKIDDAMYDNKCSSIGIATELRTGTVHALTRQNEDAPMFRFTASSNYTSGDTFTVDGVQVSALLVDGTPLPNMAYIIGSEVLCVLKGTLMTVFANRTTASDSDKLGGKLPSYYATDSDLDALEGVVDVHTGQINEINRDLTEYDNFNYNLISYSDYNYGDTSNAFTIPNDTLLVRVRFWFDGNSDPLLCYLNFDRQMPRLIQIADHYDATYGDIRMTVEVNWRTMKAIVVSNTLPNANWHIGIQFYK